MHEFKLVFLEHEDWPEWFTLGFYQGSGRKYPPRLILGIAKEPLHRLVAQLPKYHLIDVCKKGLQECGIEANFLLNIDRPWGFGGVLEPYRWASRDDGHQFVEYSILIPQVEKDAGKCKNCDGEGRDTDDWECIRCLGTGRERAIELGVLNRITATLQVLMVVLDKPDKELLVGINTKRKQLLSLATSFNRGNAYISAVLARPFGDYVRTLSEQELPEVKAAIKRVYLWMFPQYKRFGDFHYRAYVAQNGQLIIDVPGDACGLYVDGLSDSLHEISGPIERKCHNVDGYHQQLALLSGLAAFTGTARKNLYPKT